MTISVDRQISAGNCDVSQKDSEVPLAWGDPWIMVYASFLIAYRRHGGFVFTSVNVPQGATITEAHMTVYIKDNLCDNVNCLIWGNDVDSAANFTDEADVYGRTSTTAFQEWVKTNMGMGWENTPNIKTIIQEIVDRPGWSANNDMCILFFGLSYPPSELDIRSWDYDDHSLAAKLHIEYEGEAPPGGASYGYIIS